MSIQTYLHPIFGLVRVNPLPTGPGLALESGEFVPASKIAAIDSQKDLTVASRAARLMRLVDIHVKQVAEHAAFMGGDPERSRTALLREIVDALEQSDVERSSTGPSHLSDVLEEWCGHTDTKWAGFPQTPRTVFPILRSNLLLLMRMARDSEPAKKFCIGDRVTKKSGSKWTGCVVGFYSTSLTPEGYAVESESHAGSVQIYPAGALELV